MPGFWARVQLILMLLVIGWYLTQLYGSAAAVIILYLVLYGIHEGPMWGYLWSIPGGRSFRG